MELNNPIKHRADEARDAMEVAIENLIHAIQAGQKHLVKESIIRLINATAQAAVWGITLSITEASDDFFGANIRNN